MDVRQKMGLIDDDKKTTVKKELTFQLGAVQLLGVDSNSGNGDGSGGEGGR